jgi:hypothetical protein
MARAADKSVIIMEVGTTDAGAEAAAMRQNANYE